MTLGSKKEKGPAPLSGAGGPFGRDAGRIGQLEGISRQSSVGSHLTDVGSLRAFRPLHDIEFDVLALLEGLKSIPLESRVMYKDILAALESDEPEAFPIVEPFDSALASHTILLS
jgi:hypothetical protein